MNPHQQVKLGHKIEKPIPEADNDWQGQTRGQPFDVLA
jgi:hypothetical protein